MKLAQSLLVAVVLHGIVFGVAAAMLSASQPVPPARSLIEVDVVAPRPDPAGDVAPGGPPHSAPRDPVRPPVVGHRHRPAARVELAAAMPSLDREPSEAERSPGHEAAAAPAANGASRTPAVAGVTASATPRYRTNPVPDYPIPSRRRREEGIVYLNVTVQPNGWPAAVSLNRSSGHPLLDQAALDAVRRWTFEPGRAGGVPVSSLVVVPVRFFLSEMP